MTPRCSSLRTRSAAEGAERPGGCPRSAQGDPPVRSRIFRAFISKDFIDSYLLNDGVDIECPSIHYIHTVGGLESNGHVFYRIRKYGFHEACGKRANIRVLGERDGAATIRGRLESGNVT